MALKLQKMIIFTTVASSATTPYQVVQQVIVKTPCATATSAVHYPEATQVYPIAYEGNLSGTAPQGYSVQALKEVSNVYNSAQHNSLFAASIVLLAAPFLV
ncbi:hypothetical protein BC833DRAFT_610332 [Globomyces pollinis-pini]|nr:hypothetical protein BC833DRAFT_610332 [Globomyces pollinis-pini]